MPPNRRFEIEMPVLPEPCKVAFDKNTQVFEVSAYLYLGPTCRVVYDIAAWKNHESLFTTEHVIRCGAYRGESWIYYCGDCAAKHGWTW